MSDLLKSSLLEGFTFDVVTKHHDATQEDYVELCLDESRTRFALLFEDGTVYIVARCDGAACVDLNSVQAMHFANAILARSRATNAYHFDTQTREFLESIEGNEEYSAWLDRVHTPRAEEI